YVYRASSGSGLPSVAAASDGFAARRLVQCSAFGIKFDSIADGLLVPSVLAWLLLLDPSSLLDHKALSATWLGLTYASLAVGLICFRRFAILRLRSSKFAAFGLYGLVVDAFVTGGYEPALFYVAFALGIVSFADTLLFPFSVS